MPLNKFLASSAFQKYINSPNYNKIIKLLIYYYILFEEEEKKLEDFIKRIDDKDIENNYINIVTNKLISKNDNKKKIYSNVLKKIGNIKYEINTFNDSFFFNKVEELLKKYNINIHPRNKRVVSNNIEKIIEIYPLLDNKICGIADLVLKTNKVLYSNKDYTLIKKSLLEFLKEKNIPVSDITLISYYLDQYYFSNKSEIIITNNIEVTNDILEEIYSTYRNDIKSFLLSLINDSKEKKAINSTQLMKVILPYEEDLKLLEECFNSQEKVKLIQEETKKQPEKRIILEEQLNN